MEDHSKKPSPRYTIASISSKDITLYNITQEAMRLGYTQEFIFRTGLDVLMVKKEEKSQ